MGSRAHRRANEESRDRHLTLLEEIVAKKVEAARAISGKTTLDASLDVPKLFQGLDAKECTMVVRIASLFESGGDAHAQVCSLVQSMVDMKDMFELSEAEQKKAFVRSTSRSSRWSPSRRRAWVASSFFAA